MKRFLPIVFITAFAILTSFPAFAQTLRLYDVDYSKFPILRGKFNAYGKQGYREEPTASELSITDILKSSPVISVTCPQQPENVALSSVIMVDVSGSMKTLYSGVSGIDLAKAAATSWINGIPQGLSEGAVGSFNNQNFFNKDFTTDRQKLLSALTTLQPNGGTDYDMGMLKPLAGALQISKHSKYKKVVIYITDGLPNFEPNVKAIVAEANAQDCMIFAVTLGLRCPKSLKDITSQTGGMYFENITTLKEAERLYLQMLQTSQSGEPCEIVWRSNSQCEAGNHTATLTWQTVSSSVNYSVDKSNTAQLAFSPKSIMFKSPAPLGVAHDTTVTVTALSAGFTVKNITSTKSAFDIIPKQFTLNENESKTLTVRYTPADSNYNWTEFIFETDVCPQQYYVGARFDTKKPGPQTSKLKLSYPNNGEKLAAGSDDTIRWNGVPATDEVKLQISDNAGKTWNTIATKATGLEYKHRLPTKFGTEYMARVSQSVRESSKSDKPVDCDGHTGAVWKVDWNPEGDMVVSASNDGVVRIWDTQSGKLSFEFNGQVKSVTEARWSPDGSKIAFIGEDNSGMVWDIDSRTQIAILSGHKYRPTSVRWNPSGNSILTSGSDGTAIIWNAQTGEIIHEFKASGNVYTFAEWSPDGTMIITNGPSWSEEADVWNVATGNLVKRFSLPYVVSYVALSPDGSKFAVGGENKLITIWDMVTGDSISLSGHNSYISGIAWSPDSKRLVAIGDNSWGSVWEIHDSYGIQNFMFDGGSGMFNNVIWSPDGSKIATSGTDFTAKIWNADDGTVEAVLQGYKGIVTHIAWNHDGGQVATSSKDFSVKIWDIEPPSATLQADESDQLFSLDLPTPMVRDVDMGQVSVGTSKDIVVQGYLRNSGNFQYRVDSVVLVKGLNSADFTVIPRQYPVIVPIGGEETGEFLFTPLTAGLKSAQIKIYTQAEVLTKNITGEGITDTVQITGGVALFGQVDVGTEKDLPKNYAIKNNGVTPVSVSISAAGPNTQDYSIVGGNSNFTLNPGEYMPVDIRFAPKEVGRSAGGLNFDFGSKRAPVVRQLFGEGVPNSPLLALSYSVNMGNVVLGKQKDSLGILMVRNKSAVPVTLQTVELAGLNPEDFMILNNNPMTIKPNQTVQVGIRFAPKGMGYKYTEVVFNADGAFSPVSVSVMGRATDEKGNTPALASALITIGNVAAQSDDTVSIPLILTKSKNLFLSNATAFTGKLNYNGAMLEPVGSTPKASVENGQSTIPFTFPIEFTKDTQLRYTFRVRSGIDSVTEISAEDVRAIGGSVLLSIENGFFRLLSKKQLMFEQIQLGPLAPNPAGNVAELTMRIIEKGITKLRLIDARGRVAKTFINGEIAVGMHSIHLDVSDLSTGFYFLHLQTPTQERTVQMEVHR